MLMEISESVAQAWTRRVLRCQLVHPNWCPAEVDSWEPPVLVSTLFEAAQERFPEMMSRHSDLKAFIAQSELDVVGLRMEQGSAVEWVAVETNFRVNGDVYGKETAQRVSQKMVRAVLCCLSFFGPLPMRLVFLSPKATPTALERVNQALDEVRQFLAAYPELKVTPEAHCSADYRETVLKPVWKSVSAKTDATDPFGRLMQIVESCGGSPFPELKPLPTPPPPKPAAPPKVATPPPPKVVTPPPPKVVTQPSAKPKEKAMNQAQLGEFHATWLEFLNSPVLSKNLMANLRKQSYCTEHFGISRALLVPSAGLEKKAKAAYWKKGLLYNNVSYRICNDWTATNKAKAEKWLASHRVSTKTKPKKELLIPAALELNNDSAMMQLTEVRTLLKGEVRSLLEADAFPAAELEKLTDAEVCKQIFGLSYPFLWVAEKVPADMAAKYYSKPVMVGGVAYRLAANWSSRQLSGLKAWIAAMAAPKL